MTPEQYDAFCDWIDNIPDYISEEDWDVYYNAYYMALKEM